MTIRHFVATWAASACVSAVSAQSETVSLSESFIPGTRYRVDLRVDLSGEINAPGKPGTKIDISGSSVLAYDERILPSDDGDSGKVLRIYRDVNFTRIIEGETQKQEIRPAVRRMIVLRPAAGKKAPFSPDGPLTFGEIDAVRVDLFSPILIPGLLPTKAVRPGDTWPATDAAALDLTGLDKIDRGKLTVTFVGPVTVGGKVRHRLSLTGTVTGVSEDGPTRQTIEATAYFDPAESRLAYVSLKGTQELLDGAGKTVGRMTGRFTMTRSPSTAADLAETTLAKVVTTPNAENTLLLYDNPDLGLRFVHPRHWRVGAVQGKQVTIDYPKVGGGILVTVEPADRTPTVEAFRNETAAFIVSQKGKVLATGPTRREGGFDRFRLDAELGGEAIRMEYAVRKDERIGGVTVAARMLADRAETLLPDVDRILKDLTVTKSVK